MGAVEDLEAQIATHTRAVFDAAAGSELGGGPAWDRYLAHYGQRPFAHDERAAVVRALNMTRGATPGEVRLIFASLSTWVQNEVARLSRDPASAGHPRLQAIHAAAASLADRDTAAYERAIGIVPPPPQPAGPLQPAGPPAPPPGMPGLGSIFANAQSTSKEVPWANMKYKQSSVLTCVHCGGPQDVALDFLCRFCRRPMAGAPKT
ncbi:hypothetical protein BH09MYX1_BH09MYX1_03680 [soil metagenome]